MRDSEKRALEEQSTFVRRQRAARATRIRKMLEEGLTAPVICQRLGLRGGKHGRKSLQLMCKFEEAEPR